MNFLKYALPAWWLFGMGLISAVTLPFVPHFHVNAVYAVVIAFFGFGLLALYALWFDWGAQKKRRETYSVEPFKNRLAKFHQRRKLQKNQ